MGGAEGTARQGRPGLIEPADVRSRISDVNNGILSVAGLAQGLIGSGLATSSIFAIIAISSAIGAISSAAGCYTEEAADREATLEIVEEESRLIALTPEAELAELTAAFEAKGVSAPTARLVAEELSAADALSAQLEIEYGIRSVAAPSQPMRAALKTGLSYLFGAVIPVLLAWIYPGPYLEQLIAVVVGLSLVITSVVLARLGHSRIGQTLARSLLIGLTALVGSNLLALILT